MRNLAKALSKDVDSAVEILERHNTPETDEIDGDELWEAMYEALTSPTIKDRQKFIREQCGIRLPITGTEAFTAPDHRFNAERNIVDGIFDMACQTCDPEQMDQLESILEYLCEARSIPRTFKRPTN